jgi:hypothetical protein
MRRSYVLAIFMWLGAGCGGGTGNGVASSTDSTGASIPGGNSEASIEAGKEAPAAFKAADIREQMIYNRGVAAAIWGIPTVNFRLMYAAMERSGGAYNQIVIWPGLLNWKNQTLTPNPDVIYAMPFFNTRDVGPVVLEVPPADSGVLNGSVMNCWQAAIEDIGPGGIDKGKGGKYLILPPGYDLNRVPAGYVPMASNTYSGYALIRSVLKSGSETDVAAAVRYARRLRVYPLSAAAHPPATIFVDASGEEYDATIPYDFAFYKSLDTMIQAEPWLERDKAMIDPLKTIGIERSKSFHPDARTREILTIAVRDAKAWLEYNYARPFPYYDGGAHWFFPATEELVQNVLHDFKVPDSYPIDNRGLSYMIAFFSAKHLGQSQFYLMITVDKEGHALDGGVAYRLHVPALVPVTQYWSMTVYNRNTHTFIRNARWMGRSSQTPGLKTNADGSVDIYFGPKPPATGESNWIPTDEKGQFEVLARFYGPKKELFAKTWRLEDPERVH